MDIVINMYNKGFELQDSARYAFKQKARDSCRWMEEILYAESPGMQKRRRKAVLHEQFDRIGFYYPRYQLLDQASYTS